MRLNAGIFGLLILLTTCRPTANQTVGSAFSIKVSDFRGKEISLTQPAQRIICLIESGLTGLYMLQAENQVVGVSSNIYNESVADQYAALDERIKNKMLPAPGNWDFVNIESIVSLQPDLVIIWASQTESIALIEEHGIAVYGVFLQSFNDVYKEIKDFGLLTGKSRRADSLIAYTQKEVRDLSSIIQLPEKEKKSVYFIWNQGLLETAGTTSTVNELIELAGAKNSCTIHQEHVVINKERLLDWNPDLIVMWYNPSENPEDILNLSELKHINAIKHQQVYELPSVFMCDLWTLKFPFAIKMMTKWAYPSINSSVDLEEEKQEMLLTLYGQKGKELLK